MSEMPQDTGTQVFLRPVGQDHEPFPSRTVAQSISYGQRGDARQHVDGFPGIREASFSARVRDGTEADHSLGAVLAGRGD